MPPAPRTRLTGRRLVALGAAGAALLALVAASAALLLPDADPDLGRRGPTHTLAVDEARIEEAGGRLRLVARGRTTLVDGAALSVHVLTGEREIQALRAHAAGGAFRLEEPASGEVVEGRYAVRVRFALDEQPPAVREALGYQPRALAATAPLALPLRVVRAAEVRGELAALVAEVAQAPRDPGALDALDRRARALGERLWIAEQRAAVHSLRLAIEEARRPAPRREAFDRHLLEAHVLAGR